MLKPGDVHWCGRIFRDENVRTFLYEGSYYKAVLPSCHSWLKTREASLFLQTMAAAGFIPETVPADLKMEGFSAVYRQHTEEFTVPLMYASCESLRESALLFLKFNQWLLSRGYALIDGHCMNTVFQGAMQPKWCDIGSIIPLSSQSDLIGIEEFICHYIYPMLLRQKSAELENLSRLSTRKGISHNEASALLKAEIYLPLERKSALDILIKSVEEMQFPLKHSAWGDYYGDEDIDLQDDENNYSAANSRTKIFTRLFQTISPATVVDIGANAGFFSRYMAAHGAEVLAVEPDENAVLKHHRILRRQDFSHRIKLMIAGIGEPVYRGEMAVALALTHHLFFTMQYPWKYIVDLLASYTSDVLLTEFMPNGLGVIRKPDWLPDNYRLEVFAGHLERYFQQVEVIDYPRLPNISPRIFLLCRGKRMSPKDDGMGTLPWDEPYMTTPCLS